MKKALGASYFHHHFHKVACNHVRADEHDQFHLEKICVNCDNAEPSYFGAVILIILFRTTCANTLRSIHKREHLKPNLNDSCFVTCVYLCLLA